MKPTDVTPYHDRLIVSVLMNPIDGMILMLIVTAKSWLFDQMLVSNAQIKFSQNWQTSAIAYGKKTWHDHQAKPSMLSHFQQLPSGVISHTAGWKIPGH